ncbi:MAG TPA: serine/threonine-protein kinase [Burkholderiales bacterium]|nr:serine/threonine-protein kinase [Burkholderiales bacterium]
MFAESWPAGNRMAANQKYALTERVDAGGMAEVYRGVAESLEGFKKNVAIKRILPNLSKNKKFLAMFLDEARLSLHLQHANVVQVFDIGVADGTYFIVMEYVDGANLKTVIESLKRQGRRMRVSHTLYLLMEVCKGLAYAHDLSDSESGRSLGIVHRDISPPNILISRMGEVKLVDFGLAKAASQVEDTEPGVVKGKFSYLSPEAASGKDVDARADIFACGIILYELLTGKRLFYGETDYQTVELVRQARMPPIAAQNSEVEPELEEIVLRALAREPDERYQHAADLQDALAQYLFSRGMKVTSRDIKQLVADSLREKARTIPPKAKKSESLIDSLIREEILQFTSLDQLDDPLNIGAKPLSPEEISGVRPTPSPGDLVDPRSWSLDSDLEEPPRHGPGMRHGGVVSVSTGPARPIPHAVATGKPPRVAEPLVPPQKPASGSGIESLEKLLEGPTKSGARPGRPFPILLVIAVVALAALGAGLAFVLRSGVLQH